LRFQFLDPGMDIIEKNIRVTRFKKPDFYLRVGSIDDVEAGGNVTVTGTAKYFYGDGIRNGICMIRIQDANHRIIKEVKIPMDYSGNFNAEFSTRGLKPGNYFVNIKVEDNIRRTVIEEKDFIIKGMAPNKDMKVLPVESWDFKVLRVKNADALKLIFTGDIAREGSYSRRPIFIYLRKPRKNYLKIVPVCLNQNREFLLRLPGDFLGYYEISVGLLTSDGIYERKTRSVLITGKDKYIDIDLLFPEKGRPGEIIYGEIVIKTDQKDKPIEAGCFLVDSVSANFGGYGKEEPFAHIVKDPLKDAPVKKDSTYSIKLIDFRCALDEFLAAIFVFVLDWKILAIKDVFLLLKIIDESKRATRSFMDFHWHNFYYISGRAEDADILDLLEYICKNNYSKWLNLKDFTQSLFRRAKSWTLFESILEFQPSNFPSDAIEILNNIKARIYYYFSTTILKLLGDSSPSIYLYFHEYLGIDVEKNRKTIKEQLLKWLDLLKESLMSFDLSFYLNVRKILNLLGREGKSIKVSRLLDSNAILVSDFNRSWILTIDSGFAKLGRVNSRKPEGILPMIIGYPKYNPMMVDVDGPSRSKFGDEEKKDMLEKKEVKKQKITVRSNFIDTAFWDPHILIKDGRAPITFKLPDSITQQDFILQASSMDCDLGSATSSIKVVQDFFIQVDSPPVLVYGDTVTVGMVITNLTPENMMIDAMLEPTGFEMEDRKTIRIQIEPNSIKAVKWSLMAIKAGIAELKFTASSHKYKDVIKRKVHVQPSGIPIKKTKCGKLKSGNDSWVINLAPDEIAHHAFLSIIPDELHGALDGLKAMMRYPYGCVEQTLGCLVPTLLVYEKLSSMNRLTTKLEGLLEKYIVVGLQRVLNYRHSDLGWGWWENDETSIFITAYVLRALAKMKELDYPVPDETINTTIERLLSEKKDDGFWVPEDGLRWDRVKTNGNGININPVVMTLRVVQSLLEVGIRVEDRRVSSSINYIQDHLDDIYHDANGLARATLLFLKVGQDKEIINLLVEKLISLLEDGLWPAGSAMGGENETTALAIRALYKIDPVAYGDTIRECVSELLKRRNPNGGWNTTSDTAAIVETFLELMKSKPSIYHLKLIINGEIEDIVLNTDDLDHAFVNLQNVPLHKHFHPGRNLIQVELIEGQEIHYQLSELIWRKNATRQEKFFRIGRVHKPIACAVGDLVMVSVNIEALSDITRFVVVEECIPAGFILDTTKTQLMLGLQKNIDHFELDDNQITLFLKDASSFVFSYLMIASRPFSGKHPGTYVKAMYDPVVFEIGDPVQLDVITPLIAKLHEFLVNFSKEKMISCDYLAQFLGLSKKDLLLLFHEVEQALNVKIIEKDSIYLGNIEDILDVIDIMTDLVFKWEKCGGVSN
ncbi:MAG: alpha-2-macroglobulin family protein, partial [Promethearchaeota archaeon]